MREVKGMVILGRRKPGRCIIETKERLSRKGSSRGSNSGKRPRKIGFEIYAWYLAFWKLLMIFLE